MTGPRVVPAAGRVIYATGVSLDGYALAPDGSIDRTAPDEELHRFHDERVREMDSHLLGRDLRLAETRAFGGGVVYLRDVR
jgi:hypothetical protein